MAEQEQSNIRQESNVANTGLNMDQTVNQVAKGQLTYALNAAVENFDATSVNYQNEPGNELCLNFPENFHLIGEHFINEQNKHIFFLTNPDTGESEIGYMDNNDCVYRTYINANCLNFNIDYPIHKAVHKITNCTTEIYWTDGFNPRRYLDLNNLPYVTVPGDSVCETEPTTIIDCNKIKIQPNFAIPELDVVDVINGGELKAGTYQFAIQYCGVNGDAYTSYYSVTNPTPIADTHLTTPDFNYPVGRSIVVNVSNLDTTGYYQYYNLAVIKTINAITSVELIGTYFIDDSSRRITYTGQNQTSIRLTLDDIFQKYPYYDIAQDLTAVQDVLVWDNLTSIDRINYQQIANGITLNWQTYKLPANEDYSDELNATNLRGYLRDEIYAFEIVFLLRNGKQTDGFHIPGRTKNSNEIFPDVPNTNPDFVGEPDYEVGGVGFSPYWKIYNTASVTGAATGAKIGNATPYQYGEFAYWESTELYPCNTEIWGDLANTPIRHHKFPDVLVSPIFETGYYVTAGSNNFVMEDRSVFPIGVKLDIGQVESLISSSNLTADQKADIVGFKIVRGNRSTNRSIVAKGILRNVGKYNREGTDYYFPNYPYNDLREDPFLLEKNNAYNQECITWTFTCATEGFYNYTDCYTNTFTSEAMTVGQNITVCSITEPTANTGSFTADPVALTYDVYRVRADGVVAKFSYIDPVTNNTEYITLFLGQQEFLSVKVGTVPGVAFVIGGYTIVLVSESGDTPNLYCYPSKLNAFATDESKYRLVFNSPETSFGTPFLGNILKLESAIFGGGRAHFTQVKKNAAYKLLSKQAQQDALAASEAVGNITTPDFNASAMFAAYQSYLQIYINGITRRNFAYSYNSILDYDYSGPIENNLGVKQRDLELIQYLIPGVQSAGDDNNINNYQRESSVYIKTTELREDGTTAVTPLPFPSMTPSLLGPTGSSIIQDKSRYIVSTAPTSAPNKNCSQPGNIFDITSVCYYGSIKNEFVNQWGQMYSYETIDTGGQSMIGETASELIVFGGDTFINKFSFKTKIPFFIDNRVGAPDDSDIFYDEIGNVAYPAYWHSSRSILSDYVIDDGGSDETVLKNIISIKAHNFDCPNNQNNYTSSSVDLINQSRTYYDGKFYLFAYGIPTFYCESTVNVDLRQAFNNKEGDFYPHVSTGIPDDWVQESYVSIAFDNSYYYNTTFSKQNVENSFSHLPLDWSQELCYTNYPFRAIYSESQDANPDVRINSWLSYLPAALFDFPQNYGKLVSLDGIQNKAVLARFENKSLLYNTLLTMSTSNPKAAYIGNDSLFKSSPPIDFAETDLGYVGSQNKMLLKIPQGQITVDAKRGQVFLISGNQAKDLSAFGSGLNRFFTDHLAFEILRYYPNVPTDNHFNGVGLHGVYDSKYDRIIITKLDYIPLTNNIKYDATTNDFYIEQGVGQNIIKTIVYLTDNTYFCNKSWTLSFNMNTQSWVSFHSYIPNWYIAENNFFYSGLNEGCDLYAIAVEEIPSTTTTTTTPAPITTTTTTTTAGPVCTLAGTARVPNCQLAGNAEVVSACTLAGTAQLYLSFTVGAPSGQASATCPASLIGWRVDTWYIVNGTIYSFGTTETFSVPANSLVTIESVVADDYYIYNPGAGFQYCDLKFKPYIDATINGITTTTYGTQIVQGPTEGTSTPHSSTLTYTFNPTQGNTYSFVAYSVQA
jgi:hypothetical protein